MKKRIISVVLSAIFLVSLCGCESKISGSDGSAVTIVSDVPDDHRTNPVAEWIFETENVEGGERITRVTGNNPVIDIPETVAGKKVVSMRNMSFDTDVDITKLRIPSGVTELNDFMGTFYIYSDVFSEIEVAADNPAFYSKDGVLYSKDNVLLCYPRGKADESFAIPDGVTAIGEYAFNNARALKSVTIPESVKELQQGAFNNCENLDAANIPSGITELTHYVFGGCGKLSELVIPERVTEISGLTFYGSDWIDDHADENGLVIVNGILIDGSNAKGDVTIPETATRIASGAFSINDELKSLVIPSSVTEIGELSFMYCTSLEHVVLPDEPDFAVEDLFYLMDGLTVEYRGEMITINDNE